jgi:hypothetical protein
VLSDGLVATGQPPCLAGWRDQSTGALAGSHRRIGAATTYSCCHHCFHYHCRKVLPEYALESLLSGPSARAVQRRLLCKPASPGRVGVASREGGACCGPWRLFWGGCSRGIASCWPPRRCPGLQLSAVAQWRPQWPMAGRRHRVWNNQM